MKTLKQINKEFDNFWYDEWELDKLFKDDTVAEKLVYLAFKKFIAKQIKEMVEENFDDLDVMLAIVHSSEDLTEQVELMIGNIRKELNQKLKTLIGEQK